MLRRKSVSDVILPKVAANGSLGSGVRFMKCEFSSAKGEAQFGSAVMFLNGVFQTDNGILEQPLVIKFNMDDEMVRNWLRLDPQFRNEVITYEKILPSLDKNGKMKEIFPKMLYGSTDSENPDEFVIVLEDLKQDGYILSKEILDLDFDHCALAFHKLGVFHALSFDAKKNNSCAFFEVINHFVETRLPDDKSLDEDWHISISVARAAEPLLKKGDPLLTAKIERFQNKLKDASNYWKNMFSVKEPMGVVGHGDFCRNNVLYKYENEKPESIKFFDLAHSRYQSPMLDFSFFFFLNCSEESRKLHREEYLHIYHSGLTSTIPDVEVPSLEEFKEEFRKKAVYGFLHCSFFKPCMMDSTPFDPVSEVRQTPEDQKANLLSSGGDQATAVTSNMLKELIDLNYDL